MTKDTARDLAVFIAVILMATLLLSAGAVLLPLWLRWLAFLWHFGATI